MRHVGPRWFKQIESPPKRRIRRRGTTIDRAKAVALLNTIDARKALKHKTHKEVRHSAVVGTINA